MPVTGCDLKALNLDRVVQRGDTYYQFHGSKQVTELHRLQIDALRT
jgi:hypothetical protein